MPQDPLDALYQQAILDHYMNPRNHAPLANPTVATEGFNPVCGDQVVLQLRVAPDGRIAAVGLQGKGCAISQSSASMMTEAIQSLSLEEADRLAAAFRSFMTGDRETPEGLGPLQVLEGVRKFPVRIKCAVLSWHTLQEAIKECRAGRSEGRVEIRE